MYVGGLDGYYIPITIESDVVLTLTADDYMLIYWLVDRLLEEFRQVKVQGLTYETRDSIERRWYKNCSYICCVQVDETNSKGIP